MQWCLIIEEFGPTMEYIKGPKNIVDDTLSHLEMASDTESLDMADCYDLDSDDLPDDAFPVSYTLLDREQRMIKLFLSEHKPRLVHTLLTLKMSFYSVILYTKFFDCGVSPKQKNLLYAENDYNGFDIL
jgi:hypothetical protein